MFSLLNQLIFTEAICGIWLIYSNLFLAILISQISLIISRFWLIHIQRVDLWLPRKFRITFFTDNQALLSLLLKHLLNPEFCISSRIWGSMKTSSLIFASLSFSNFDFKKSNVFPFRTISFTKFLIIPRLICRAVEAAE